MAAVDMATLPPAGPSSEDGLVYSRHYAKKIRDMGRSSKESWIKKLWNHMFKKKEDEAMGNQISQERPKKPNNYTKLPPINQSGGSATREGQINARDGTRSAPVPRPKTNKLQVLPAQLMDSPYLSPRERSKYALIQSDKNQTHHEQKAQSSKEGNKKNLHGSHRNLSNPNFSMKKPSHPYLSTHQDTWRPRPSRGVNIIQLEKRAKSSAEKAIKDSKVFTCEGPYPVDAFVRWSLRKRGWVEKFGHRGNAASSRGNSGKLECQNDEDFEAICDQGVPAPWEEEYGLHAMISRCCRHFPAKFIWGGRGVNSLVVKSEVIVNHFPKARYFSSKVLLTASLKELPWTNHSDPNVFFPRCYLLNEDEKEDFIEDFRLTACMSILRRVLKLYTENMKDEEPTIRRENTKYVEVTFSKDKEGNSDELRSNYDREKSIFDTDTKPEKSVDEHESNPQEQPTDTKQSVNDRTASESDDQNLAQVPTENIPENDNEAVAKKEPASGNLESGMREEGIENSLIEPAGAMGDIHQANLNDSDAVSVNGGAHNDVEDNGEEGTENRKVELNKQGVPKILPDLKSGQKANKKKVEVPLKAVEWALMGLDRFVKFKLHEDIDSKKRSLSNAQWNELLGWSYKLIQEGATMPITEGKLKESNEMLKKLKKIWPQFEIDGDRNIWILKPGDKSKGMGIEFIDKLDGAVKFINNTTTQGNYVIQKYIERPLLLYNCKFDVRQWFLVTDWNPLTMWFYKDSYLRICSQEYSYESMHESVHLSNVAVQENYLNGKRSDKLPDNNFMSSADFSEYLKEQGHGNVWDEVIYPGMKKAIINTLVATQDIAETRRSAFELYGADFMYSEDFQPMLLEINSSPGMAPTSVDKAKLCAKVIDDVIKVVLDRKENRGCDTGGFELAYRENPMHNAKCVETKFLLEGQRIKKTDLQRYTALDQRIGKQEKDKEEKAKRKEMIENGLLQEEDTPKVKKAETTEGKAETKTYSVQEIQQKVENKIQNDKNNQKTNPVGKN